MKDRDLDGTGRATPDLKSGRRGGEAEEASDLMRIGVDAVVTRGTPAVRAARRASPTVPIIMASSGDPAYTGAVKSLARPEGNVTGLSSFSKELEFKRIELLKEIAPATKRVGVLYNVENPVLLPQWELLRVRLENRFALGFCLGLGCDSSS